MTDELHKTLRRYLRKVGIDPEQGPSDPSQWSALLERLNRAFQQADQDRYTLERSLDISSREMQSLYAEIKEDSERLSAVLASLPQAVVYLTADLHVLFGNTGAARLMAVERDAPLDALLELYDSQDTCVPAATLALLLEEGRVTEPDGSCGTRSETFPASWQLSPVRIDGVLTGAVLVVMNISTLKEREAALRNARVEAQVAVVAERTRARFLANMSHELRTPLNAIIGYSEMLKDDLGLHSDLEAQVEDLGRVIDSANHLLHLINDLLDISKVDAGKMELVPEMFALDTLLMQASETVAPLVTKQNNRLEIQPTGLFLFQDRTRLLQNLLNLVSNAAKFTQDGVIRLRIQHQGERVRIEVSDSGEGIPEEKVEALFKPFEQADRNVARIHGGTGLGLSLTKRFVEMMGGTIEVHSELGVGTTFAMDLPIDVRGQPAVIEVGEGPVVLVCDDDPATHVIAERSLVRAHHRLVGAFRPEQGIALALEHQPAVIVLDLTFPGVRSGWDVLEALRLDPRTAEIPVIICTVHDERRSGYDRRLIWLRKPLDGTILLDTVQRLSRRSRTA